MTAPAHCLPHPNARPTLSTQEATADVEGLLQALGGPGAILVDCTATESTTPWLQRWLHAGGGVVLANKKPLTAAQAAFDDMTAAARVARCRYESAVGAGTPFVACVSRVLAAGDAVRSMQGTFSGTLGYLTTGLEDGRPLSELVREAHRLGLTEPDPRDDLSGMDVARKALILARTCAWPMELSAVEVEPLFPAELADVPLEEFYAGLARVDDDYRRRGEQAQAEDCVLRYVASVGPGALKVGLQAVPRAGPLGALRGTDNILQLHSDIYADRPLVVQGSGAGAIITAAGVIADCVEIASLFAAGGQ